MPGFTHNAPLSISPQITRPLKAPAGAPDSLGQGTGTAKTAVKADAKLHDVARKFESVFMTEMLHLARPTDKAAHGFSTGESGGTWDVFMDQALGEAATAHGGTGLAKQIEDSLRRTHAALKESGK